MIGAADRFYVFGGESVLEAPPVRTKAQQGLPPTEEEILYQQRKEEFMPTVLNDLLFYRAITIQAVTT